MRSDQYKSEVIKRVIASCITPDHVDSCEYWVGYLIERELITEKTYEITMEYIHDKRREILSRPVKRSILVPHVKKRADRIEEEERRRHLKLVKTAVSD